MTSAWLPKCELDNVIPNEVQVLHSDPDIDFDVLIDVGVGTSVRVD